MLALKYDSKRFFVSSQSPGYFATVCARRNNFTLFLSVKTKPIQLAVASHAGDFRGACISSLPTTKYELP